MSTLVVQVPGREHGKERPRAFRGRDNKVHVFSPDKAAYQNRIALFAKEAMDQQGLTPFAGPVWLRVLIDHEIPKSWSRRKRGALLGTAMAGTPDTMNVLMAIADGLTGVAYADDRQVANITLQRRWWGTAAVTITVSAAE